MKLIEALKITQQSRDNKAKGSRVSVVCGFNPLHLITFLEAELRLRHPARTPEIRSGVYGDFWGNLERAQNENNEVIIIFLEWTDLDARLGLRSLGGWSPSILPDLCRSAENRTILLEEMIRAAAKQSVVCICLPNLPLPPIAFTPGWQASELELTLKTLLAHMGQRCAEIENARMLSPQRIDQLSPLADRFDIRSELTIGFPYHLNHASILAAQMLCLLEDEPPKKGLITDLDGTLWRGIVGEEGAEGIAWDLDHRAQIHGVYQQFLHSLAQAGILIGVASKNDPELVQEAFRRNDILLSAESIFPMEVNWGPKSESVDRILQNWNFGANSVVFVDDSAAELAEVQAHHPQIQCMLFAGEKPETVDLLLQRLRDIFGKRRLLNEDSLRNTTVQLNRQWRQDNAAGGMSSRESFLREAQSEVSFSFAKEPLDPRAFELINKTNQFNLNGRRYSSPEWISYIHNPEIFLLIVSYRDKYGPLGKVAILTGWQHDGTLAIDNWVMSCRAFGRRIEHKCLKLLFDRDEVTELEFDFNPTERNKPLQLFLRELLGVEPVPGCIIKKRRFLEQCPETFHALAELSRG